MRAARTLAAALLAVATVAACGGDDGGAAPPTSSGATTVPGTTGGPFTPAPIEWQRCGDVQCATVEVPLDYADPGGTRTAVYVSRVAAGGDRIGPLFVNPGGPGATATDFAQALAQLLPESVTDRFDLVAVEPRGVAGSGSVDCDMDAAVLYAADPTLEDEADRAALLEVSSRYVDGCLRRTGEALLRNVGTRDVARDMDTVRAAMGDEQLSYLGASYGTSIGQVYAQLFPARVRAMALDGVVELGSTGLEKARAQALGFELALDRWAAACRTDDGCTVRSDPIGAFEQVTAAAERAAIPAPEAGRPAGPSEVNLGAGYAMYSPYLWGQLDAALADALAGDGSRMVELADEYLAGGDTDVYFAVNCLDEVWPTDDPAAVLAAGKAAASEAPHFGEAIVVDYVRCAMWPVAAEPLEPSSLPGTPTILVISTTGDPATPYESGVRLAAALDDAVLLTKEGDGHGAIANLDDCIDDALAAYLLDLDTPPDGTVCGQGAAS